MVCAHDIYLAGQSRVVNAENGDASMSIELLIRTILATGALPQGNGQEIADVE